MSKLKFLLLLACIVAGSLFTPNTHAAPNSVVRFRISYGYTVFADIDVELFDDAKPITVSNFLYQVQTDSYDRSFLHRVVPGFVVQGGLYAVDNPYPSALFETMKRIPEGPPITNEFNVGQRLGNTFGTLAMALSSTNIGGIDYPLLNSATASWFFNLVDNTDQLDPNYCVFGRVKTGASKLKFFNTLSEDEGMIVMQTDFLTGSGLSWWFSGCTDPVVVGEGDVQLAALPVAYFFFDCPYYSDLFNVQIRMISGKDVAPPKIIIAPVGVNQTVSNDTHMVSGTVTDNVGVKQVRVYLGAGPAITADLNTNTHTWSATLTNIPPGTNIFYVEATDTSGNRITKPATFFRSAPVKIGLFLGGTSCIEKEVVTTNGMSEVVTNIVTVCGGAITGATNEQILEIGRGYRVTATPVPGNIFAGWFEGGNLVSFSPTYPFIIYPDQTNRNVTASFNTNLFPYVKGTYTGVFCNTNQVEEASSGFVSLTVGDLGAYSAKVSIGGKTYPMTSSFDSGTGKALGFIDRPAFNLGNFGLTNETFGFRLALDLTPPSLGGTEHLSGSVSNYYTYGIPTNVLAERYTTNMGVITTNFVPVRTTNYFTTNWTAELHADRAIFSSTRPAPLAGKYTLLIPSDTNTSEGPFGDGYGTATVSTKGSLTFSGSLADGTKVSQKAPISKNGDWPLYVSLYKNRGMLLSRIILDTNQPDTDLSGLMNWFKRTHVTKYFGAGFTNESMIVGSRFIAPIGTNRVLALTNAVAGFTNGNLMADFANDVTVDAAGKVTNQDTNKLSMTLSKSTGLMSGSATPQGPGKAVSFKGAVLQKQKRGAGYFLGTNASGRVSLDAP